MSESAAGGAESAPLVADHDGAPVESAWPFDHGVTLDDSVDAHLLALSDEGLPIDMLMATPDLVQVDRLHDDPFFNDDDEIGDWSGTVYDAPRLLSLGGQAYDLVIGGSYAENVHVLPDHPAFAGWGDTPVVSPVHDLLVDLGVLAFAGEPSGLAPFGGAAVTHAGSDIWGGAIIADLQAPELSWLAGVDSPSGHVGEAWAWDADKSAYVFHHFV